VFSFLCGHLRISLSVSRLLRPITSCRRVVGRKRPAPLILGVKCLRNCSIMLDDCRRPARRYSLLGAPGVDPLDQPGLDPNVNICSRDYSGRTSVKRTINSGSLIEPRCVMLASLTQSLSLGKKLPVKVTLSPFFMATSCRYITESGSINV
jgi:hypothetical protein